MTILLPVACYNTIISSLLFGFVSLHRVLLFFLIHVRIGYVYNHRNNTFNVKHYNIMLSSEEKEYGWARTQFGNSKICQLQGYGKSNSSKVFQWYEVVIIDKKGKLSTTYLPSYDFKSESLDIAFIVTVLLVLVYISSNLFITNLQWYLFMMLTLMTVRDWLFLLITSSYFILLQWPHAWTTVTKAYIHSQICMS